MLPEVWLPGGRSGMKFSRNTKKPIFGPGKRAYYVPFPRSCSPNIGLCVVSYCCCVFYTIYRQIIKNKYLFWIKRHRDQAILLFPMPVLPMPRYNRHRHQAIPLFPMPHVPMPRCERHRHRAILLFPMPHAQMSRSERHRHQAIPTVPMPHDQMSRSERHRN